MRFGGATIRGTVLYTRAMLYFFLGGKLSKADNIFVEQKKRQMRFRIWRLLWAVQGSNLRPDD